MSIKYKAITPEQGTFCHNNNSTLINLFIRLEQKQVPINALNYCQQKYGTEWIAHPHHQVQRLCNKLPIYN